MDLVKIGQKHRSLIRQLCIRDVQARYRGSTLGMGWAALQPLLMLSVYTLVFSQVFKAKWGQSSSAASTTEFALQLFAGLIAFGIFAECASRAPTVVTGNPNFVTKVVFPLEVLALTVVGGALFQAAVSMVILAAFELATRHSLPITFLLTPVALLPLVLWCLAGTWLLAALGVYLRDLSQIVGVAINLLMYLSPIFYPEQLAPPSLQRLLVLNPLTHAVSQFRDTAINGVMPSWLYLAVGTTAGLLSCEFSLKFFLKAKRGFADVI